MLSNVIMVTNITHFKELVDRAAYILNHGDTKEIILDFSDMDYLPSSIVGAIISIADKVKALGGKLALQNVGQEMLDQFASLNIPIDTITPDVDLY
jgi:anti-anti-sigma factor